MADEKKPKKNKTARVFALVAGAFAGFGAIVAGMWAFGRVLMARRNPRPDNIKTATPPPAQPAVPGAMVGTLDGPGSASKK